MEDKGLVDIVNIMAHDYLVMHGARALVIRSLKLANVKGQGSMSLTIYFLLLVA